MVFNVESSFQYRLCIIAHSDRVTGISVGETNECFSVGDDCKVKCWNLTTGILIAEHSGHQVTAITMFVALSIVDFSCQCLLD